MIAQVSRVCCASRTLRGPSIGIAFDCSFILTSVSDVFALDLSLCSRCLGLRLPDYLPQKAQSDSETGNVTVLRNLRHPAPPLDYGVLPPRAIRVACRHDGDPTGETCLAVDECPIGQGCLRHVAQCIGWIVCRL